MAEWALIIANSQVYWGWVAIAKELRPEAYIEMYSMEWFTQPTTPHVDIFGSLTNPTACVAMGGAMGHKVIRYTLFHLEADRPSTDHRHTSLFLTNRQVTNLSYHVTNHIPIIVW